MNSCKMISPLRQRMIEDMRMRKLAPHTQAGYIRAVRQFARYLRRPPDTATAEDLRNYQLYLVDHGTSPISLNAAITGLKFFFGVTLERGALMAKMQHVFVPRTLPVVLSRDEVRCLIAAAGNLKYQTALSVAYGAGLRASEVVGRLCIAGADDLAVLSAALSVGGPLGAKTSLKRRGAENTRADLPLLPRLHIGGMTGRGETSSDVHLRWRGDASVSIGDVVKFRLVNIEPSAADAPDPDTTSREDTERRAFERAKERYFALRDKYEASEL